MKLILTRDVKGLGRIGEVVEVSDGYARNFLIPKHLALPATTAKLTQIQKEEMELEARIAKQVAMTQDLKKRLEKTVIEIQAKTNGEKLFAAIHPSDILAELNQTMHLSLEPKQVIIKQIIKTLGIHDAEIKLNEKVYAKVKIQVKSKE